ncbi:AlpA family phage regulatory protein [Ferrimonas balearica]|uniref:helix-turn-helix transcriptional regulator n=1 Tax=Ferrimonas balearica TaxID=44012 RepID=UPI001C56341A|nr:AlpA family phage regulatory protein [Ferrimonas balearica]MBW3140460.1 AlpA family phage regulatory protein [Ferrimonas balearica]
MSDSNSPITHRLIRIAEACELTSLSNSRLWQLEQQGKFPKRIRLGHRTSVYRLSDVEEWLKAPISYQQ